MDWYGTQGLKSRNCDLWNLYRRFYLLKIDKSKFLLALSLILGKNVVKC